jgi:hypothetical protein
MTDLPPESGSGASAHEKTRRKAPNWKPGQSGNPKGRPPGCRNRVTMIAEALIGKQAQELTTKAIALALSGDATALRLCLERIIPPARERPLAFKLPKLETCGDAILALGSIAGGLANGKLLPHEAESLSGLVAAFVKTVEISNLEDRLAALEQAHAEDTRGTRYDA